MLRGLQGALHFQYHEPGSLCPGTEATGMSTYVNLSSHLHSTIQILRPSQDGMKTEIGKEERLLLNLAQSSLESPSVLSGNLFYLQMAWA